MKEDPIEKLLKESIVKTSDEFTDELMGKLVIKQMLKVRSRLYILIASVIACLGGGTYLMIRFGGQLKAFGLSFELPKIAPLVVIGFIGLVVLMHLSNLIRTISSVDS